ncbi:LysE family translocator [bacterium]|nr:LysE family translocator [bacterium]
MTTLLPDTAQLLAFIGAGLALNIIPGQDMLYVIVQSSQGSMQRGLLSALAIGCGTLFHIAAVSLGLAGLLAAVPIAYSVVRIAGAIYLVWLGISMWRTSGQRESQQAETWQSGRRGMFLQGMLTNMLNPKVALFFLALLPQFCDPARGSMGLQLALLGLIFCVNGTLVLLAVSLATHFTSRRLGSSNAGQRWLKRFGGSVLALLGLRLLLQRGQ